jgi:hypothetical protein
LRRHPLCLSASTDAGDRLRRRRWESHGDVSSPSPPGGVGPPL